MNRRVGISRLASLGPWLAVAALLLSGPTLRADDNQEDYSKGTHVFRLILQLKSHLEFEEKGFTEKDEPSECVIVILGDPSGLRKVPRGLNQFLAAGGAVLFATDKATFDIGLLAYSIRISGDMVACNDSDKTYRGSKWCPLVEPTQAGRDDVFADLAIAPAAGGRRGLATNLTSYLDVERHVLAFFKLSVLANLPAGCVRVNNQGKTVVDNVPERLPFAVGGPIGDEGGRLLVIADHSIFINLMMQQTDNGNLQFGFRVAAWLNESGKRKKVLFIEDGVLKGKVEAKQLQALPIPPEIPKPSLDALIGVADQLLGDLEQEDVFNKFLVDNMPPPRLMRWLLILFTLLLVYYGFSRSRRGRHRLETAAPLLAIAVRRGKPNASAIELRHQSLVSGNNLWEPARVLARQFFESALGGALAAPPSGRVRLPPFQVELRGLRGWFMAQRVRRLWRFAHQPVPQPVTMRQFRKFARKVADLKDAVAQGRIRFSSTPQPSVAR